MLCQEDRLRRCGKPTVLLFHGRLFEAGEEWNNFLSIQLSYSLWGRARSKEQILVFLEVLRKPRRLGEEQLNLKTVSPKLFLTISFFSRHFSLFRCTSYKQ